MGICASLLQLVLVAWSWWLPFVYLVYLCTEDKLEHIKNRSQWLSNDSFGVGDIIHDERLFNLAWVFAKNHHARACTQPFA